MDVHRFFGAMLAPLPGTPARDLSPTEFAAAMQVHGEAAVHLRWTRDALAPPTLPPSPSEEI